MGFPGRPSEFKEEYCEQLIEFMAQGFSYSAFAGSIRKSVGTLDNWANAHESFREAKEIGFAASQYWWEQQGKDGLYARDIEEHDPHTGKTTKTHISSINAPVWIFNMKARHNWSDRVTVVGEADKPVTARLIIEMPAEETPEEEKKAA